MVTYGAKLRTIRTLFGLTQEQVAERAKIERRDIIKFEQGVTLPTPQTSEAIQDALGINLDAPEIEAAFQILVGKANGQP